jgi:cytochrome P450
VAVTGYDEALAVYRDHDAFSSCNVVTGPIPDLPFTPEGDDISALIEQYRNQLPLSDHFVTFDQPKHLRYRALVMGLITPKRLKENEEFMWRLADRLIDPFLARGACELVSSGFPKSINKKFWRSGGHPPRSGRRRRTIRWRSSTRRSPLISRTVGATLAKTS